jgi:hypothetical protein
MEELNTEFAEARYALADAEESVGTTYFSDDLEDARDATEKVGAAAALGSMTLILVISLSAPRRSQVLERYKAMQESLPEGSDARMELHSHPVEERPLGGASAERLACPGLRRTLQALWLRHALGPSRRDGQGPMPDERLRVRPSQSGRFLRVTPRRQRPMECGANPIP